MKRTLVKANESQVVDACAKALGVKAVVTRWQDFAEGVDDSGVLETPFTLGQLTVIYERLPLYQEILHPRQRSFLRDVLDSRPYPTCLFMDNMMPGPHAPHIVKRVDSISEIEGWTKWMTSPKLIVNEVAPGEMILAAPLKAFTLKA